MRSVLLITLILLFQNSNSQSQKAPNFIFILADDQGWNGTSVEMLNGLKESKSDFYETPEIEKIAKEGMKFSYAYASAPVCAPSRYSIQMGKTPARLQMIRVGMNTNHINHETSYTIPKQLKKINSNYKTAHFGKWGMDSNPKTLGYDKVMEQQKIKMEFSIGIPTRNSGAIISTKTQKKYLVSQKER
tara:strand:+ start:126 stop:689 length:564 start_codon:yes stop_codon:yes gene_type:complete